MHSCCGVAKWCILWFGFTSSSKLTVCGLLCFPANKFPSGAIVITGEEWKREACLGFLGILFVCFLGDQFTPSCVPDVPACGTLSLLWLLAFVWRLINLLEAAGSRVR